MLWDWKNRKFISATQLMAQSLRAANETLSTPGKFILHEIHTNFIRAGSYEVSVLYKVERISDGRAFASRVVRVEQNNKLLMICLLSFRLTGEKNGSRIMRHSDKWKTCPIGPPEGGRDDVELIRPERGCNIEGYVLPNVDLAPGTRAYFWFLTLAEFF